MMYVLKKYGEFCSLNESKSEDWPPEKYKNDILELKKLFMSSDYEGVKGVLGKFKDESSGENTIHDIYYPTKYPSQEIEKNHNIEGISKIYNMPFGFDEEKVENLLGIFMEDEEVIDIIFEELLVLNDELSVFSENSKKTTVIGGVCSRFSIEDIKDYQDNKTEIQGYNSDKKEYIIKRIDKFYSEIYSHLNRVGVGIGYFPSMDTLLKIRGVVQ